MRRREALGSVGAILVAGITAGCSGGGSSDGSSSTGDGGASGGGTPSGSGTPDTNSGTSAATTDGSSIIRDVAYHGDTITVDFPRNANIDGFALLSSNGSSVASSRIGAGESRVTLSLESSTGNMPSTGAYTLGAVRGDRVVDEREITLAPEIELVGTELVTKDPPTEYVDDPDPPPIYTSIAVTLANTGTLPARVNYLGLTEGVLEPNDALDSDALNKDGAVQMTIQPGNETTRTVNGSPLRYSPRDVDEEPPGTNQTLIDSDEWEVVREAWCTDYTSRAKLVIRGGNFETVEYGATLRFAGEASRRQVGLVDIACTEVSLESDWTRTGAETETTS